MPQSVSDDMTRDSGDENKVEAKCVSTTRLERDSRVSGQLDTVFDILNDASRRYLLYFLHATERGVYSVEDAVDVVRAYEAAGDDEEVRRRKFVWIDLVHSHLPRLDEAGVVDYSPHAETVRYRGYAPLEEWLEHACYRELD